jgi:hypothetical protein
VEYPGELKSLLQFCKANALKSAIITTIDKEAVAEKDGVTLNFIPASIYAYGVGVNTLLMKRGSP